MRHEGYSAIAQLVEHMAVNTCSDQTAPGSILGVRNSICRCGTMARVVLSSPWLLLLCVLPLVAAL